MPDLPPKNGLPSKGDAMSPPATLTPAEAEQLALHENTIRKGLNTFYQVGIALTAIRDQKLYRATHRSFEAYVIAKWEFCRSQAYRLIDAAAIIKSLKDSGVEPEALPSSDRQTRALAPVPREKLSEVWREARKASPDPTGKQVEEARGIVVPTRSEAAKIMNAQLGKPPKGEIKPSSGNYAMPSPEVLARGDELQRRANCIVLEKRLRENLQGYGDRAKQALEIMDLLGQEIAVLTAE